MGATQPLNCGLIRWPLRGALPKSPPPLSLSTRTFYPVYSHTLRNQHSQPCIATRAQLLQNRRHRFLASNRLWVAHRSLPTGLSKQRHKPVFLASGAQERHQSPALSIRSRVPSNPTYRTPTSIRLGRSTSDSQRRIVGDGKLRLQVVRHTKDHCRNHLKPYHSCAIFYSLRVFGGFTFAFLVECNTLTDLFVQ